MVEGDQSFPGKNLGPLAPIHEQTNNHKDLIHLPGNYKELIVRKIVELDIVLPESELNILEDPKSHNGSEALYLLEQFIDGDLVLVSFLGPNRKTSKHLHRDPMGTEQYYSLAGEAILTVGKEELVLDRQYNFRVVPLDTAHQLRTRDNFALTLIVMKNAELVPAENLHIPVTS